MERKKRVHKKEQFHSSAAGFNSDNAAIYIGVNVTTLKLSRHTGLLCGVTAPKFIKLERKIIYMRSVLDKWLADQTQYNKISA